MTWPPLAGLHVRFAGPLAIRAERWRDIKANPPVSLPVSAIVGNCEFPGIPLLLPDTSALIARGYGQRGCGNQIEHEQKGRTT
jgi:hypothetical protein